MNIFEENRITMSKVHVKICVGTTCFVMGASELQDLEKFLPDDLKDKVEISGAACLGLCRDENYGEAPFVTVDGEPLSNATVNAIVDKIREKL